MENFAPVSEVNTIRIWFSIAVNLDWSLRQFHEKNVFINCKLEEEVFMKPSLGFEDRVGSRECKLEKALYRLKQSPQAWFDRFIHFVKLQGYLQAELYYT